MSQLSPSLLLASAAYFLPALVWGIIAADLWAFSLRLRPRNAVSRLLLWLATTTATFFAVATVFTLLPLELHMRRPPWLVGFYVVQDVIIIVALAMTRHLSLLMPPDLPPPSRRWLLTHYGIAALLIGLTIDPRVLGIEGHDRQLLVMRVIHFSYIIAMLALSVAHGARYARRGLWRPGSLGHLRTADIVVLGAGVCGAVILFLVLLRPELHSWSTSTWVPLLNAGVGLMLATPIVVRGLGMVMRSVIVALIDVAVVVGIYLAAIKATPLVGAELLPQVQFAAVFLPVLLLLPLQGRLRDAVGQMIFRRRRRRELELHEAILSLSPELGIDECCRRTLEAFVRIMRLRGAGILLERDGRLITVGAINLEPLRGVWPLGAAADALPAAVFGGGVFRELPAALQDALIEAEIVAVTPISSPRRRWGCGFVTTGMLRASFSLEEIDVVQALIGQFALRLDAAELLERAVTVERSLAHSEKLAAVGEMAARVAHEIRNPVTAARSLAQLMVRDPSSPHAAEHAELILAELGRVERQVQALLRFARREELSVEAADVGALARSALESMRAKLEANGVRVDAALAPEVMARADREKLRQVVVNLLDNAADAVAGSERKAVALAVFREGGQAVLEVRDSGPGVPAEVLPRLFEPFFSLKTNGTGLGLAIVKRTIEAHGGRVEARGSERGLLLRVELPALAAAASAA